MNIIIRNIQEKKIYTKDKFDFYIQKYSRKRIYIYNQHHKMPRVGTAEWNRQRNMMNDTIIQATDPSPPVMVIAEPQEDVIKQLKKKVKDLENQMTKKDKIIYKQNTQLKEKEFLIKQFKKKIQDMQNGMLNTRMYDIITKQVVQKNINRQELFQHVNKISQQHKQIAKQNEQLEDKITNLQYKNMMKNGTIAKISQKTFTEKSLLRFQEVEIADLIENLANTVEVLSKMITMCQVYLGTYFKITETQLMMKIDNEEIKKKNNLLNDANVHISDIREDGSEINIDIPIELQHVGVVRDFTK